MAARILADRRYTGEGGFPSIIQRGSSTWCRHNAGADNALPKEPSPEGTAEAVRRQPAGLGGTAGTGSPEPPDPAPRAHCLPSPRAKPPSEVEKLRRELDELLHRPPVDEAQAKNLAFRLAALQLDAIGPEEYETRRLRRLFQGRAPMAELEQELLHESVRGITVSNGTVAVQLKNNQTLEGGNCT